ncbi:hypothetical protein [Pseudarthrobacter sp. PvP090]|uniref:hypothetical protein n=1 Tax=Pseudarthrobacter sp. PvP090 TaxID=3156393 RepID=UPI00339A6750
MYLWLFRHLPGPLWLRILLSAALLAGALVLLVDVVFPWLADITNLTDATVG